MEYHSNDLIHSIRICLSRLWETLLMKLKKQVSCSELPILRDMWQETVGSLSANGQGPQLYGAKKMNSAKCLIRWERWFLTSQASKREHTLADTLTAVLWGSM